MSHLSLVDCFSKDLRIFCGLFVTSYSAQAMLALLTILLASNGRLQLKDNLLRQYLGTVLYGSSQGGNLPSPGDVYLFMTINT